MVRLHHLKAAMPAILWTLYRPHAERLQSQTMKAFRASLLWFPQDGGRSALARFEEDGMLVLEQDAQGRWLVRDIGHWRSLRHTWTDVPVEHLPGRIIAPGLVDLHIHFPQTNVIG